MRWSERILVNSAAAVFFGIFCGTVFAGTGDAGVTGSQQMSDFSLSGFGERGKKSWDLAGKSADIGSQVIKLNDITGNFYGADDQVQLTADKGDFDRSVGSVHLQENVVVKSSSGAVMTTDSLDWDRDKQLVSTPDRVNLNKDDIVISGQGAQGFPDLNKVDLQKDIQVQVKNAGGEPLKPGRDIVITCDGPMQVDYEKSIATFNNAVSVETRDGVIKADCMEVFFSGEPGKDGSRAGDNLSAAGQERIMKIIARGNVSIVRDGNQSYSDEAVYTAADRRIVLKGRPKLVIYSEEVNSAPLGN
jgi:LPS export ABC transporter protein LptC